MNPDISRRDFLKTTSITAAGVAAASVSPFASPFTISREKSRVVIAKDTSCLNGSTPVFAKIQDMVDHAIMTLTGVSEKAKAYEALFPQPVTTSTKIAVKYNGTSATGSVSNKSVRDALKNGLLSMLNGTFPATNIVFANTGSAATSNPSFKINQQTYRINNDWVNCTWIINIPVCWGHNRPGHGVTLSLKNHLGSISGTLDYVHAYGNDETYPWMSIVNNQATFKNKQVLVLLDAICGKSNGGPGGSANFTAHKILASKDPVACDYQGTLILEENGLNAEWAGWAKKVFNLAAKSPYMLGNDDPANMEIVNIGPPWNTGMINDSGKLAEKYNIQVFHKGNRVDFIVPSAPDKGADILIFDMHGRGVWRAYDVRANVVTWQCRDIHGNHAADGMYVYKIRIGKATIEGVIKNVRQ